MNEFEVVAAPRTETGKGAMRRLRRTGKVPAVLYGAGKESVSVTLSANEIKKQLEREAFASHVLTIKVGSDTAQAVLKAVDRDPATSQVIHLDFLRVSSTHEIHINVPLHFINEDSCPGKKMGGVANHLLPEVEVGCLPGDLPEYIEVDMQALALGDSVHLSELVLPENVRLMALVHNPDNDQAVVTVQQPQKMETGEDEEEAQEGDAAAATGA